MSVGRRPASALIAQGGGVERMRRETAETLRANATRTVDEFLVIFDAMLVERTPAERVALIEAVLALIAARLRVP